MDLPNRLIHQIWQSYDLQVQLTQYEHNPKPLESIIMYNMATIIIPTRIYNNIAMNNKVDIIYNGIWG